MFLFAVLAAVLAAHGYTGWCIIVLVIMLLCSE
jgi:hypothetical protein